MKGSTLLYYYFNICIANLKQKTRFIAQSNCRKYFLFFFATHSHYSDYYAFDLTDHFIIQNFGRIAKFSSLICFICLIKLGRNIHVSVEKISSVETFSVENTPWLISGELFFAQSYLIKNFS